MLHLNKNKVMAEKQMRPKEYINHLKNLQENSFLNGSKS